jgi:hypothetical protein
VPAEALALAERPGDERAERGAHVDPHVEDREPRVAAAVVAAVELPTMVLTLGLKNPVPTTTRARPA